MSTDSIATQNQQADKLQQFVSMKNQTMPFINRQDFAALQEFESKHPELYKNATAPHTDMITQANAFNLVFYHTKYKTEFKKLINK